MKKLFLMVLCFFLVASSAQAGAGGDSAMEDNSNLRHAGKSSMYFYNVEATDNHGYGKLAIDTDKHTFSFIGKDFKPSQYVHLQFNTEGDFAVFASGKSTPSGNLHITGTWESDALPTGAVGAVYCVYPCVNGFQLTNYGAFMAKLAVYWTTDFTYTEYPTNWHETAATDSFGVNHGRHVNLDELGVPLGAWVRIHAIVVGGKDRTGDEIFTYAYGQCYLPGYCYPDYTILHTTWNPILEMGATDCFCTPWAN